MALITCTLRSFSNHLFQLKDTLAELVNTLYAGSPTVLQIPEEEAVISSLANRYLGKSPAIILDTQEGIPQAVLMKFSHYQGIQETFNRTSKMLGSMGKFFQQQERVAEIIGTFFEGIAEDVKTVENNLKFLPIATIIGVAMAILGTFKATKSYYQPSIDNKSNKNYEVIGWTTLGIAGVAILGFSAYRTHQARAFVLDTRAFVLNMKGKLGI